MNTEKLVHPISITEQLMAHALNKSKLGTGEIRAIKITKRGIYIYNSLSYNKDNCNPILKNETAIYKDEEGLICIDEIQAYISHRPRIKMITYQGETGVRLLLNEGSSTAFSPESESEIRFDTAVYLFVRELFPSNTAAGEILKNHYKLRPNDFTKLDAKFYLMDYQFKSKEDRIAYDLYTGGYTEGFYDSFTGILYGVTPSGERVEIEAVYEDVSPGRKCFGYSGLGVRIETSSVIAKATTSKETRSIRYRLPAIDLNKSAVEHFKSLKDVRNGIVLTNDILPDDLINYVYYYNSLLPKDKEDLNNTSPTDILVLEREYYSSFNPYLLIEPIRDRNDNEVVDIDKIDANIKKEALSVGYSVIIVRGVNNITEDLVSAADRSLIYIIDDFLSISDVQHKLENIHVNTTLIMNKVIGIMDIKRMTYFKMNRTIRDIITNLDICGNQIMTTSFIKVEDEYKNFNSYILELLQKETTERILISKKGLTLVGEDIQEILTEISFNNMLSFLAGLSDENIYQKLLTNPIVNMTLNLEEDTYKISAYMEKEDISIIIKKLNDVILEDEFLPEIELAKVSYIEGKNITFILRGKGRMSMNAVTGSLIDKMLHEGEKILLIDTDYSINENIYPEELSKHLELIHSSDEHALYDIVNSSKPTVVLLHKARDEKDIRSLYSIAPLVPNIFVTSKFTTYEEVEMNYIRGNIGERQYSYYTNQVHYTACEDNHFKAVAQTNEEE